MRYVKVLPDESAEMLSARLKRPVCMLLRANRLYSAAWLLSGREILLPDTDFCQKDAGTCPCRMLQAPAREADAGTEGRSYALRPYETLVGFARRTGANLTDVREFNRFYTRPVPGKRLFVPIQKTHERV